MEWIFNQLRERPELAIFLTIFLGFWLGKLRIGKFTLGTVTSVLLVGVVVGQLNIAVPGPVKSVFFLLFLFAVGYKVGPQFFRGLKKDGLPQVAFAVLMCVSVLGVTWLLALLMGYNMGEAAGLLAGSQTISAVIGVALAIMAYLGGHLVYSSYLDIMYIPGSEELVVYAGAFIGALVGFLWYNAFPASVFMGDTGSLTLGGILAVFAILIRKELLIPLLCLVFFLEDLSVILQVAYFKVTKRKYGAGKRIFKMTPLHHHFQKPGNAGIDALIQHPIRPVPESKIVTRFWIVSILLAALTFVTLKIR